MQAVLCGYYGFGNGGDEALLATLLQMLPSHVAPMVLSADPNTTSQLHGVNACDRKNPQAILKVLKTSKAFIWGGGSLIQDATSAFSPVYYTGLMGLAQGFGLTTIAWAQGIGPLKRATTRLLARRAFQGCNAISVRDRASATLVSNWNLPCTPAPDPVWALQASAVPNLQDLPSPRIAVTLRSHPQLTSTRLQHLTQALIDLQAQSPIYILLVPFQASQDLAIAQSIQAQLQGPSQVVQLSDPRQLKGVFQAVDMAIAMRLHALIMAASEGCRCFAISYDPKVQQLIQDLQCPSWTLEELPADPEVISQAWLNHCKQGAALSPAQIRDRVNQTLLHQQVLDQILQPN